MEIKPHTNYLDTRTGELVRTGTAKIVYKLSSIKHNPDAGRCVRAALVDARGLLVPESVKSIPVRALAPA